MVQLEHASVEAIQSAYKTVTATFLSGKTRPVKWRQEQLTQLGLLVQENEKAFAAALKSDLGRHENESMMVEVTPIKAEIAEAISHVKAWSRPKAVKTVLAWKMAKPTIHYEPKGAVLVIGTWNYPLTLTLGPMVGAIAAGNSAILKPAEQAPALAMLLANLFPRYLDSSAYIVVNGAVEQSTELLKHRFDHIFYTGSGNIGKIIAKAAAEHLTPVTLELGGKSPAVIFDDANLKVSARRIAWGKFVNAGQTCIAPDYVLCTQAMQPKFVQAFKEAMAEFTKPTPGNATQAGNLVDNKGFAKIVNENHFNRVKKLLDTTKGSVVYGGNSDDKTGRIEVTLISDVSEDDSLMQGEIFGPLLPIMVVRDMDQAVDFINRHDNPLALYVFTSKKANSDKIFKRTRSGGFVHNDVLVQFAIAGLPFGGAGPSGYGNYHGKASFLCFSHERATASVPAYLDFALKTRYPPYTPSKVKQLLLLTGVTIRRQTPWYTPQKLVRLAAILVAIRFLLRRLIAA